MRFHTYFSKIQKSTEKHAPHLKTPFEGDCHYICLVPEPYLNYILARSSSFHLRNIFVSSSFIERT